MNLIDVTVVNRPYFIQRYVWYLPFQATHGHIYWVSVFVTLLYYFTRAALLWLDCLEKRESIDKLGLLAFPTDFGFI